jgi:hypothetical protein
MAFGPPYPDDAEELEVRLDLMDAADVPIRSVAGAGRLRGGCCKQVSFSLSDDGTTLVEVER